MRRRMRRRMTRTRVKDGDEGKKRKEEVGKMKCRRFDRKRRKRRNVISLSPPVLVDGVISLCITSSVSLKWSGR